MKAMSPPEHGGGGLQARVISAFLAENVVADHAYHYVNGRCTCGTACKDRRDHQVHIAAMAVEAAMAGLPDFEPDCGEEYSRGYAQGFADGRNP